MRKVLIFLLLAGAATPALAAGGPRDIIRAHSDSKKSEDRADRSDRGNRGNAERGNRGGDDNNDRPRPVMRTQSDSGGSSGDHRPNIERRGRSSGGEQPAVQVESNGGGGGQRVVQRVRRNDDNSNDTVRSFRGPRVVEAPRSSGGDSTARIRRGPRVVEAPQATVEDRAAPVLRQQTRPLPRVLRDRVPIVSRTPREGTQPAQRAERRRRDAVHWSTTRWRGDHRYDWRDHRRRHRSHFHLGIYFDPFGWNYRPYSIGWRLWPSYYSSRYWLNDPWSYRLPYAPPGYRWIRYYDDALLVDTWDGRVVDVIYNFFW